MTNWDKWQSYRRDRGVPPWIKVYRSLMSNAEWATLSDAEKGQLVSLWLVAADKNGELPADPIILRKMCQLDEPPDINKFIELDFVASSGCQDDAKTASQERQHDAPETEIETERKKHPSGAKKETKKPGLNDLTAKMFGDFAKEKAPSVNVLLELEKFRDWCRAKGRRHKDNVAAFRNWLRKAQEFHDERKGGNSATGATGEYTDDQGVLRSGFTGSPMEGPEA